MTLVDLGPNALHWQVLDDCLIHIEAPPHGAPAHRDEVRTDVRQWLYEQGLRHVLARTGFDAGFWMRNRTFPMPTIRFLIGLSSAEAAFAFKMRWG